MESSSAIQIQPRRVPMKVLVLGLCRTGTMSVKIALELLGYEGVYHMSSVFQQNDHPGLWIAALEGKFEMKGSKFTVEQWNHLLGAYQAVTDIPAACFVPELIAMYPCSKVILTTRSTESWYKSMLATVQMVYSDPLRRLVVRFRSRREKDLSYMMDLIVKYYFGGDIKNFSQQAFEEHNNMVRQVAKNKKCSFLEFRVKEGWGPLCEFLGKEVPDFGFPHVNDSASWSKHLTFGAKIRKMVLAALIVLLPLLAYFTMGRSSNYHSPVLTGVP